MRHAACLAAALGCVACGPSVTSLLAQNRWADAACSVRDAGDVEKAVPATISASAARVRQRNVDLHGLALHPYALAIVDAHYATVGPVETMSVSVANGHRVDGRLEPLTGESVLPSHMEKRTVWAPKLAESSSLGDVAIAIMLAVLTGGMTTVAGLVRTEEREVSVPPSDRELMDTAPRATSVSAALHRDLSADDLQHAYALPRTGDTLLDVNVRLPTCEVNARYAGKLGTQWFKLASLEPKRMSVTVYPHDVGTVFTVPVQGRTVVAEQDGSRSHGPPVVVDDVDPPKADPRPPRFEERQRGEIVKVGAGTLLGAYGLSLFSGWIGDLVCNGSCKDHAYDLLYLPVAGPAIAAALPGVQTRTDGGMLATLLIADTVIQAGALITILVGMLWHEKVPISASRGVVSGLLRF